MRIVISGEDEVALQLVEALMGQHAVTLVAPETAVAPSRLARLDARVVRGSLTSPRTLREAGVEGADVFVGCSEVDEQNLVACVSAKRLGTKRTICFLTRSDLQLPGEDARLMADALGVDQLVRPGQQLAEEMLRTILVPHALEVQHLAGGQVQLARLEVDPGAVLTKGEIKTLDIPQGVVLVMAQHGSHVFVPRGDTRFEAGDRLTAMGTPAGIHRLARDLLVSPGSTAARLEATVVGGGTVGSAIAAALAASGWRVKLIEADHARSQEVARTLGDVLVLHGDGTDLDLLKAEAAGEAQVLVAVTSDDQKNLLVSLLAKSLGVERILTRADHLANERLFLQVGIDVVRSSRGAALRSVLRGIGASAADLLVEMDQGEAMVLELTLPPALPDVPLARMKAQLLGIIGAIVRRGRVIVPRGSDHVEGGDHVLVFCVRREEAAVRDFFLRTLSTLGGDA